MTGNDGRPSEAPIAPFRAAYAPADEDIAAAFLTSAPLPPQTDVPLNPPPIIYAPQGNGLPRDFYGPPHDFRPRKIPKLPN